MVNIKDQQIWNTLLLFVNICLLILVLVFGIISRLNNQNADQVSLDSNKLLLNKYQNPKFVYEASCKLKNLISNIPPNDFESLTYLNKNSTQSVFFLNYLKFISESKSFHIIFSDSDITNLFLIPFFNYNVLILSLRDGNSFKDCRFLVKFCTLVLRILNEEDVEKNLYLLNKDIYLYKD